MKTLKYIVVAIVCCLGFVACENMDWLHKEYLQDPSIHSAKLPYVAVNAGFERVVVSWAHPTDQVSTGLRIRYGLGNNLEEIILDAEQVQSAIVGTWKGEVIDETGVKIETEYPLCEYGIQDLSKFNTYYFYVCSMDKYGNPSLISEANAEIYTMQKLGGEDFKNVVRPRFYLYDNAKSSPELTGHRLVIKELSGIINLCTAIEWKLKDGDQVIAEGAYDRVAADAEIENGNPEQTGDMTTLYWDRYYERTQFVELSNEWADLEGIDNEKVYKVEYTYTFNPCVFMDKFGMGYYYQSICVDSVTLTDSQDVVVEKLGWKIEDPNSHPISKNLWYWLDLPTLYGEYYSELKHDVNVEMVKGAYPEDLYPYLYDNFTPASYYSDPNNPQNWRNHHYERLWDDMLMVDADTGDETYMDSYWRATSSAEYPASLFFCTGQDIMINRIGMTFARDFDNIGTPGIYELWVSNDKEKEDGILEDWEMVGTFVQTIDAKGEYSYDSKYIDGVIFRLFEDADEMTKRCRNIRIRILQDLSDGTSSIPAISEVFLYGIEGSELPPDPSDDDPEEE